MKQLTTILALTLTLTYSCKAQFRTLDWGHTDDTTALKNYAGGARGMYVVQDSSFYILCFTCTLTPKEVLQGIGTRKWLKIPKSSGTGSTPDSLDYRTTTQLTDTSYKLNRPNGTETVFRYGVNATSSGDTIGIKIPRYVDSVTKASDSFRVWKGGSYTALKDSSGGGAAAATKNITIESPSSTENIGFFFTKDAITITQASDVVVGTSPSVTYQISFGSQRSVASTNLYSAGRTVTSTSGSTTTTFANASIPANSWVFITTSATSGTVTQLSVTLNYQ